MGLAFESVFLVIEIPGFSFFLDLLNQVQKWGIISMDCEHTSYVIINAH